MSGVILYTILNLTNFVQKLHNNHYNVMPLANVTAPSAYFLRRVTTSHDVTRSAFTTNDHGHLLTSTLNATLDMEEKHYWALSLLSIPAATIFGNMLVITSVCKYHHLHSPINYFILGMAVADLLVAIAVMPFAVYVEVNNGLWEFGPLVCDLFCAADVTCSTASIFLLTIISFDRYVAATQPIKYASSNKGVCHVTLINLVAWFVALCIASPMVLGLNNVEERDPDTCRFFNADFIIYSSAGSFCIPLILIIYLYARIWCVIKHRSRMAKLRHAKLPMAMSAADPNVGEPLLSSGADKQGGTLTLLSSNNTPCDSPVKHTKEHHQKNGTLLNRSRLSIGDNVISSDKNNCNGVVKNLLKKRSSPNFSTFLSTVNSSNNKLIFSNALGSKRSSLQCLSNLTLNELLYSNKNCTNLNNTCNNFGAAENNRASMENLNSQVKKFSVQCEISPADSPLTENSIKNDNVLQSPRNCGSQLDLLKNYTVHLNEMDLLATVEPKSSKLLEMNVSKNSTIKSPLFKRFTRRSTGFFNTNFLHNTPELFRNRKCTSLSVHSVNSELSAHESSGESANVYDNANSSLTNSVNWCSEQDEANNVHERKIGANLEVSEASGVQPQLSIKTTIYKRKVNRKICKSQRKERKATKTLAIVLGVFLVCWVPFFALNVLNAICMKLNVEACQVGLLAFSLSTWLGYMNSFMNPIIYTIFNIDFRKAFKQLLCPCCGKKRNSLRRV